MRYADSPTATANAAESRVTLRHLDPAVRAVALVKHYRSRSVTVEAVRGIDLEVTPGEIFGFLGPNGAGKSTTVRMLTTLLSITSGTARVGGVDVARHPDAARRRMGVALQEAGLDPRQTGRELLVLQGRLFGLSARDAAQRAQELLALVEIEEAADRLIKGYSGGMRRRLDLASALVHEPEVLFLDEPTTGLDPASRLTVWDEVRRINQRGTTVFLTTQYLEEADQLCDRLAIIDGGRIVREGTPQQLKAELRERKGLSSDPSLDEVFLDATGRTRSRGAGEVQEVLA
jgi:ABC-2 type transport system ATP-binding protein